MTAPINPGLSSFLACPKCKGTLSFDQETILCINCEAIYAIKSDVPRFVHAEDDYADNFGFQWNKFRTLQLDSKNGSTMSYDRILRQSGKPAEFFKDKLIFEAGCGAGRFTENFLKMGAKVVAVDLSSAVDACHKSFGASWDLLVVQGDITKPPLKKESFDVVVCFGVLQHTPKPLETLRTLAEYVKPGGYLFIDCYRLAWFCALFGKYYLRPFTKRMSNERLLAFTRSLVNWLLPVSNFLLALPGGRVLHRIIPVANIRAWQRFPDDFEREWSVMDTFDALGPEHDHPQTVSVVRNALAQLGSVDAVPMKSLVVARVITLSGNKNRTEPSYR